MEYKNPVLPALSFPFPMRKIIEIIKINYLNQNAGNCVPVGDGNCVHTYLRPFLCTVDHVIRCLGLLVRPTDGCQPSEVMYERFVSIHSAWKDS